ncbi:hypothetical protein FB45DRAFT_927313 [Roridomyces roridus]|uniref:Uncharacterized protein n=1 Tax=Roridomyces roridus TaxID=1738132 RepID=A0AAD7FIF3_9AGAR|nr:hypothetical protein FB45DRAFT_927313 [Roridomyces roridus]
MDGSCWAYLVLPSRLQLGASQCRSLFAFLLILPQTSRALAQERSCCRLRSTTHPDINTAPCFSPVSAALMHIMHPSPRDVCLAPTVAKSRKVCPRHMQLFSAHDTRHP